MHTPSILSKRGITKFGSTGFLGRPTPMISNLVDFWQEPITGDLMRLAVGDYSDAIEGGTITEVAAGTYHAGAVTAVGHSTPGSIQYPSIFTDLTTASSFWIGGLIRRTSTDSNKGLWSVGGSNSTDAGGRVLTSDTTWPCTWSNGEGFFGTHVLPTGAWVINEWHSFTLEYLNDLGAGTISLRLTIDGNQDWTSGSQSVRVFTVDNSSALPFAKVFRIGWVTGGFQFLGDILMCAGRLPGGGSPTWLNDDQMTYLHGYQHGRLWTGDAETAVPRIKMIFAQPREGGFDLSVRRNGGGVATVKALNASTRAELDSQTLPAPTNGFSKASLTGLGNAIDVIIETHYPDGTVDGREGHYTTVPADNDYTFAIMGCSEWSKYAGVSWEADRAKIFNIVEHSSSPLFVIFAEDFGYFDLDLQGITTIAGAVDRFDEILNDFHTHYIWDRMPLFLGFGDHAFENDGDSTSDYIDICRQLSRAMCPNRDSNWGDGFTTDHLGSDGWYFSVVINDVRFIMMDASNGKIKAGVEPTARMIDATQLAWWKAEITAAAAAGQIVVNNWVNSIQDTSASLIFWSGFPVQRAELFDHISSEFGTTDQHMISVVGDVHMQGIDDGSFHGDHDTAGLLSIPCIIASQLWKSVGATAGTWSHGPAATVRNSWGRVELTNDEVVAGKVDAQLIVTTVATDGVTPLSVTLTK